MAAYWTMKGGRAIYVRRAPRAAVAAGARALEKVALGTADAAEATVRARAVNARCEAYWAALIAGAGPDEAAFRAAVARLAAARGVVYRSADALAEGPIEELLARLRRVAAEGKLGDRAVVAAELGLPEPATPTVSEAFGFYLERTANRLAGKTAAQVRRWRAPREKAVRAFVAAAGDKRLHELTRADALAFHDALARRIAAGETGPQGANKDIGHLAEMFRTVERLRRDGLPDLWGGLAFKAPRARPPAPLTPDAIRRLLAGLDGLNPEAADILRMMANTSLRPLEAILAPPAEFLLDHPVPHLDLGASGRPMKTGAAPRKMPLVGVSLAAARRFAEIESRRYVDGGAFSAAANKYLRARGLLPPGCTVYSFRHGFQDRLNEAGPPERVNYDLMGHTLSRERYGAGVRLETLAAWVRKVAVA